MSERTCAGCGHSIVVGSGHYSIFERAYHPSCYDRMQGPQHGDDILVVDENITSCELLASVLRGNGHAVRVVRDAEDAMCALADIRAKLVVIDLRLPGMSTVTLIRRVRAGILTQQVPVIVVAPASVKEEQTRSVLDAGASVCCIEPITSSSFTNLVNVLLDYAKRGAAFPPLPRDWRAID